MLLLTYEFCVFFIVSHKGNYNNQTQDNLEKQNIFMNEYYLILNHAIIPPTAATVLNYINNKPPKLPISFINTNRPTDPSITPFLYVFGLSLYQIIGSSLLTCICICYFMNVSHSYTHTYFHFLFNELIFIEEIFCAPKLLVKY